MPNIDLPIDSSVDSPINASNATAPRAAAGRRRGVAPAQALTAGSKLALAGIRVRTSPSRAAPPGAASPAGRAQTAAQSPPQYRPNLRTEHAVNGVSAATAQPPKKLAVRPAAKGAASSAAGRARPSAGPTTEVGLGRKAGKRAANVVNHLLQALPRADRRLLMERFEPAELTFGTILCEPDSTLKHVYFPLTGFISLVALVKEHQPLEMGLIGSEGMLGATLALGVDTAPLRGVVQGAGSALRIAAAPFRRILRESPALQRVLNRYLYVMMAQLSQTAACTRFHEVEARLARWLLMTHDRAHADHFHLTHQFLADMLGVRRSGVTTAAGALQERGLIRYSRGDITVTNRTGLEAKSCECYDAVIEDYARLLR